MDNDVYKLVGKFECCGNMMVAVIIKDKAVCVMSELEYNKILRKDKRM